MSLQYEELQQGYTNHFTWKRDTGNLVIIIIDDEIGEVNRNSDDVNFQHQRTLPQLREYACRSSDIRAIGFFRLMTDTNDTLETLDIIDKWVKDVSDPDHQVRFLVDVFYGGGDLAGPKIVDALKKCPYSYQHDQIAYLTQAGTGIQRPMPKAYGVFSKPSESDHFERHGVFTQGLMSFLGIGLHKDDIINEAIRFYARAWEARWVPEAWDHNALEKECSDHSKALADWLGIDVHDLCNYKGQSAKALMIWLENLFSTDVRQIQGKVLNAVLKKLDLPLSTKYPIPDDEFIYMPCIPCFPFLVSLRSFLLRCEEEAPVSQIRFFQDDIQDDKEYTFQLMMNLDKPAEFEERFRETICEHGKKPLDEHPFTSSLRYLVYCITDGLPTDMQREYMRLFTKGKDESVVKEVKVCKDSIKLIW